MSATKVRQSRVATSAADYAHKHRDSPIAKACSDVGPLMVTDSVRADIVHAVSLSDLRRAYALGVCSASHGFAADVHQTYSGLWPHLSPADYLAEWVGVACHWHKGIGGETEQCSEDQAEAWEAQRFASCDQWAAELVTVAPVWYVDWLARLVHPPKWLYLVELGAAQWLGAPAPSAPAEDWGDKVRRQWARRAQGAEQVARVVEALEEF